MKSYLFIDFKSLQTSIIYRGSFPTEEEQVVFFAKLSLEIDWKCHFNILGESLYD